MEARASGQGHGGAEVVSARLQPVYGSGSRGAPDGRLGAHGSCAALLRPAEWVVRRYWQG